MMKIHQYSMLCAPITSQMAALEALENGAAAVAEMRDSYRRRRDFVVRRLNEIGLDCHEPGGAFYVFPDVRKFGLSSKDFAMRLLEEELTDEQLAAVYRDGLIKIKSPYAEEPYTYTRALLEDGAQHMLLNHTVELDCPVRLLHGIRDDSVPWQNSLDLATALISNDVEVTLVKTGDHRLSGANDIARLRETVIGLIKGSRN